jgi:hypothetical protein
MLVGLSEPLRSLVRRKYKIARASGELFYSETSETAIIRTKAGIPVSHHHLESLSCPLIHTSSNSATAPLS